MRAVKGILLLVGLLAVFLGMSAAQDYRATVQGVVTDSSLAVVSGAKVTLRNDGTGVETSKLTNEAGHYTFDMVEPGVYTVVVEQAGFGRFEQEKVQVQVRGDVTVNAVLKPGAVSETVTVSEAVAAVQFNSATMDLTIEQKQLEDLPVLGRNPFSLALLNPAAENKYNNATPPPYYMWAASTINIGSWATYRSNDILLDGVSIQVSTKGSYSPPMDAVQEFTVETNSVDAEFGHTAGGILSIGMKSGTNGYHGTAAYYGRNPDLNAVVSPITRTPSLTKNNIGSATFGGPIKKNKLFNFAAYERWWQSSPSYMAATLPTDAMKTGDFSQAKNVNGGQLAIFDPWSTVTAADGTVTRAPFPGNMIPASRIDPAGQHILNDLWAPNSAGDDLLGSNNFKTNYGILTHYWNFSDRADYYVTDKLRSFVRYSQFNTLIDQSQIANSPAVPNGNGGIMNSINIAGDTVYTLNATTVLDFRLGYSAFRDDYANPLGDIGQAGLAKIWGSNTWYEPYTKNLAEVLYPAIYINGPNSSTSLGNEYQWYQRPEHFTYSAKLLKQYGIHNLKFGAEGHWDAGYMISPNPMAFSFDPTLTANTYQNPNTGLSGSQFASMLLGATGGEQYNYASWNPALDVRSHYWSAYAQDDVKLTRRLSLNLGLRWEYETSLRDLNYQYTRTVDMTTPIPEMAANPPVLPAAATALRTSSPQWAGGWEFTSPSNPYQFAVPKHEFLPRVGVAYRLSDKSVLRFGFARYVQPTTMVSGELSWINTPGYGATTYGAPSLQGVPGMQFSNPFPATNPLIMPTGNGLGLYTNLGNPGGVLVNPNEINPQISDRYNVSYQRELPGHFTFDGTYFLDRSRNIPATINENMMDPNLTYSYKQQLSAGVANPFYNYLTPATFPGSLRYQPTVPLSQLLRPDPAFGDIDVQNVGNRKSHYQAVQLRAQRSFTNGASFLFTYYYTKERQQNYFNDIDQYDQNLTYQTMTDPRHRISAAGSYILPFGKGRKLLPDANRVLDAFVGGWTFSSIFTWHSGDQVSWWPGAWTTNAMALTGAPLAPTQPGYSFNPAAFAPQPAYTPRENPWSFEGVFGPRFWNIDSTFGKTFDLTEKFRLKFRLETYNTTNSFMPNDPNMNVYGGTFGKYGLGQAFGNTGRTVQYSLQLAF